MTERTQVLWRVQSADARAAFEYLESWWVRSGFKLIYKPSTKKWTVKINDENRHPFAWTANVAHLLFYIRKPAKKVAPHLEQLALEYHGDKAKNKKDGETTIRLENMDEAKLLTSWLIGEYQRWAA